MKLISHHLVLVLKRCESLQALAQQLTHTRVMRGELRAEGQSKEQSVRFCCVHLTAVAGWWHANSDLFVVEPPPLVRTAWVSLCGVFVFDIRGCPIVGVRIYHTAV